MGRLELFIWTSWIFIVKKTEYHKKTYIEKKLLLIWAVVAGLYWNILTSSYTYIYIEFNV